MKLIKDKQSQNKLRLHRLSVLKSNTIAWLLILPAIFLLFFYVYRPQFLGTMWSFFNMKGFSTEEFVGFENYKRILLDTNFQRALVNTLKYVALSIVVGYVPPIILAICLDEIRRFRKTARFIIYFPSILPAAGTALMWYFIFYPDSSGLLNMFLGKFGLEPYIWLQDGRFTILYIIFTMTWSGCGPATIYYFSSLQSVQTELYEAVTIDGGSFWTKLRVVTLPHLYGIALLFFVKQIFGVFSIMDQPMLMTDGGPNGASDSLGYLIYKYGFIYNKPQFAMALGVIMFVLLISLTFFYQRMNKKVEEM